MKQGNFQLNNTIVDELLNFATSIFDLFFLMGPEGSTKSESIEYVVPKLSKDYLVFRHFCFSNTVIDDFLLNFYDGFRDFSLAKKISLKKFMGDSFKEKINHYFKTIEKKCVIIVENFEKIENNSEIIDFLCHIATFENIKIIIVSKNEEKNIFRFRSIKTTSFAIEQIKIEDFIKKLEEIKNIDDDTIEKFYNISKGRELFLEMTLKFLSITNIQLKELIEEFNSKNEKNPMDFEEFIVSKFVNLTPKIYLDLFRILCLLNPCVSTDFINVYNLGEIDYIDYLSKNFLINYFEDEIYVKDYFKKYILDSYSSQERLLINKKLIEIFETELTKSPKDRLLRLSRESIRKEIDELNKQMPFLTISGQNNNLAPLKASIKQNMATNLSFFGIQKANEDKAKKESILNFSEKLKKIKERKQILENKKTSIFKDKEEIEETSKTSKIDLFRKEIIEKINQSKSLSENYKYQDAINCLKEAENIARQSNNTELLIETIVLIAKNYELLNDFNDARNSYLKALDVAFKTNSKRKSELEFSIALTNKNLFKLEISKEQFTKIANSTNTIASRKAKAFIELGEIFETQSKINDATKNYLNAIPFLEDDKELLAKCYYKLALIYDENEDIENAIKYYQKNYMLSNDPNENKYYSISLNNMALIYSEQSNYQEALKLLKLALDYDNKTDDLENIYFTQKELAKLYSRFDENEMEKYYNLALDNADKLNDQFKKALIYFELGEYYYDKEKDSLALTNFELAKEIIKENDDENLDRINLRIKDIKTRMNYGK